MNEEIKQDVKLIDVTWKRAIKIYWSMLWRIIILSLIAPIIMIYTIGIILHQIEGTNSIFMSFLPFLCIVFTIIVSFFVLKSTLNKQYSDFRISLIEN